MVYHGPDSAPLIPVDTSPTIPSIETLVTAITRSLDRLFFISYHATDPLFAECLVRVSPEDSVEQNPACLQYGCFLVEFYIPHSSDVQCNGTNQRHWLQYHSIGNLLTPTLSSPDHLVEPSVQMQ